MRSSWRHRPDGRPTPPDDPSNDAGTRPGAPVPDHGPPPAEPSPGDGPLLDDGPLPQDPAPERPGRVERRCSRNGCHQPAVATLTYVYAASTAVVGPLALAPEPHTYDLCAGHARSLTAPRGWQLVRNDGPLAPPPPPPDDLTALAEAVWQPPVTPRSPTADRSSPPADPPRPGPGQSRPGQEPPRPRGRPPRLRLVPPS